MYMLTVDKKYTKKIPHFINLLCFLCILIIGYIVIYPLTPFTHDGSLPYDNIVNDDVILKQVNVLWLDLTVQGVEGYSIDTEQLSLLKDVLLDTSESHDLTLSLFVEAPLLLLKNRHDKFFTNSYPYNSYKGRYIKQYPLAEAYSKPTINESKAMANEPSLNRGDIFCQRLCQQFNDIKYYL